MVYWYGIITISIMLQNIWIYWIFVLIFLEKIKHPAGTSTDSDKCDLSKDSDFAPLTLGSMEKSFFTTYFVSHRKPI